MPAKKRHPLFQAQAGTVFAVAIAAGKWGFVRFYHGMGMAVLPLVGSSPQMPDLDWKNPPKCWILFSFALSGDKTEVVLLGTIAFENEAAAWGPPTFSPPDVIEEYYRIHDRGVTRKHATAVDVRGMVRKRVVTPADLAEFLQERLRNGELKPVRT